MSPAQARNYLDRISSRGMKPGLERIRLLMEKMGHPEKQFKSVHITGTNGKGSTAAMLESILRRAGNRTGLYTSPHMVDLTERIVIQGRPIEWKAFAEWIGKIKTCAGSFEKELTYFETVTAAAFCAFAGEKVKIAVIEVGLGGRFDATNVIPPPEIAVITNVSLEHTEYLGGTLQKIAWEKSHIIKGGSACVTGITGSALKPVRNACKENNVSMTVVRPVKQNILSKYKLALKGSFQALNLGIVLACVKILRKKGWKISAKALATGLQTVKWPGRFELKKFGKIPLMMDGAHNPGAIKILIKSLKQSVWGKMPCRLIFNTLQDKNALEMSQALQRGLKLKQVLVPKLGTPRSSDPAHIAELFAKNGSVSVHSSVKSLWDSLRLSNFSKSEFILATGSFYVIGESRKALGWGHLS